MVRLTIALEDKILERARTRACQEGISLDDLLRSYLESYGQGLDQQGAIKNLLDLSLKAQSGSGGRKWTRDELYER